MTPPFDGLPNTVVNGWKTILEGERDAMYALAKGRRQAVDLGTFMGQSAAILSLAAENVHTIDLYDELKGDEYKDLKGHSVENTKALCETFANITFEKSDTVDAAFTWDRGAVDVLFVDASHTKEGTLLNALAWHKHMPAGAIIIFHDDNAIHPGVQKALCLLKKDHRFRFFPPGKPGHTGSLASCEVQ